MARATWANALLLVAIGLIAHGAYFTIDCACRRRLAAAAARHCCRRRRPPPLSPRLPLTLSPDKHKTPDAEVLPPAVVLAEVWGALVLAALAAVYGDTHSFKPVRSVSESVSQSLDEVAATPGFNIFTHRGHATNARAHASRSEAPR